MVAVEAEPRPAPAGVAAGAEGRPQVEVVEAVLAGAPREACVGLAVRAVVGLGKVGEDREQHREAVAAG
jgi:hypothetical protein